MHMIEKLSLTNYGHFHEHKFEGALESLRPLLPKFLQSTAQRILYKDPGLHPYTITTGVGIRFLQSLN